MKLNPKDNRPVCVYCLFLWENDECNHKMGL